jgi:hypothetical protein
MRVSLGAGARSPQQQLTGQRSAGAHGRVQRRDMRRQARAGRGSSGLRLRCGMCGHTAARGAAEQQLAAGEGAQHGWELTARRSEAEAESARREGGKCQSGGAWEQHPRGVTWPARPTRRASPTNTRRQRKLPGAHCGGSACAAAAQRSLSCWLECAGLSDQPAPPPLCPAGAEACAPPAGRRVEVRSWAAAASAAVRERRGAWRDAREARPGAALGAGAGAGHAWQRGQRRGRPAAAGRPPRQAPRVMMPQPQPSPCLPLHPVPPPPVTASASYSRPPLASVASSAPLAHRPAVAARALPRLASRPSPTRA